MSPEENPPEQLVVEAMLVEDNGEPSLALAQATLVDHQPVPQPIASDLDRISANGGAVGAVVLGVWSLIGVFITNWSIINSLLGMLMGFWGLTSRRKRLAWVGIFLCLASAFLSILSVSQWVGAFFVDAG